MVASRGQDRDLRVPYTNKNNFDYNLSSIYVKSKFYAFKLKSRLTYGIILDL